MYSSFHPFFQPIQAWLSWSPLFHVPGRAALQGYLASSELPGGPVKSAPTAPPFSCHVWRLLECAPPPVKWIGSGLRPKTGQLDLIFRIKARDPGLNSAPTRPVSAVSGLHATSGGVAAVRASLHLRPRGTASPMRTSIPTERPGPVLCCMRGRSHGGWLAGNLVQTQVSRFADVCRVKLKGSKYFQVFAVLRCRWFDATLVADHCTDTVDARTENVCAQFCFSQCDFAFLFAHLVVSVLSLFRSISPRQDAASRVSPEDDAGLAALTRFWRPRSCLDASDGGSGGSAGGVEGRDWVRVQRRAGQEDAGMAPQAFGEICIEHRIEPWKTILTLHFKLRGFPLPC